MMRDVVQDKRREGSAVAAARAACRSRAGLEWLGHRARGGAHVEHALHGCDAGRVEAQRLVERRGLLPSERRAYDAGRGGGREAAGRCGGGGGATSVQGGGPDWRGWGAGNWRSARKTSCSCL